MAWVAVTKQGSDAATGSLFSHVDLEERVPARHPLRRIRAVVSDPFASLDGDFDRLHPRQGQPSTASERLIRASLLQILGSIRSVGQLLEQMDCDRLFQWVSGLGIRNAVWVPSMSATNRDRLRSRTGPARSWQRSWPIARSRRIGHRRMADRSGPIVQSHLTRANGRAERRAAIDMLHRQAPGSPRRVTLAADPATTTRTSSPSSARSSSRRKLPVRFDMPRSTAAPPGSPARPTHSDAGRRSRNHPFG